MQASRDALALPSATSPQPGFSPRSDGAIVKFGFAPESIAAGYMSWHAPWSTWPTKASKPLRSGSLRGAALPKSAVA